MDIRCPVCGEPWDIECLHDESEESRRTFAAVRKDFSKRGCAAIGATHSAHVQPGAATAAVLFDLLGDDIDGIAAMLEDADMLGMLN